MKGFAARIGWMGDMLIVLSVLCLVYSGGIFTHATEVQATSQPTTAHHQTTQSSHHEAHPCKGCLTELDEQQMHCGAKILALCAVLSTQHQISSYDVPAHKIRDLIAQIFTPDPPPPRVA